MCDTDYDERAPVWDEQERTARVPHTCTACHETVPPGFTYRRTAVLFDGSWSTYKHCCRCASILDALRPRLGEAFGEVELDLDCGEVWDHPPPHVANLAFALPTDDWRRLQ